MKRERKTYSKVRERKIFGKKWNESIYSLLYWFERCHFASSQISGVENALRWRDFSLTNRIEFDGRISSCSCIIVMLLVRATVYSCDALPCLSMVRLRSFVTRIIYGINFAFMSFVLCASPVRPFDGGRMDWYHFTRMKTCVAETTPTLNSWGHSVNSTYFAWILSKISPSFIGLYSSLALAFHKLNPQLHSMNGGAFYEHLKIQWEFLFGISFISSQNIYCCLNMIFCVWCVRRPSIFFTLSTSIFDSWLR